MQDGTTGNTVTSRYRIVSGSRKTSHGRSRAYTLYLPEENPGPPYRLVMLLHGFLRSGHYQSSNAKYLAERGFAVLTPDLTRLLWFDANRMNNVFDALDHINWLADCARNPDNQLHGLLDCSKLSIAGYSAGGAAALELLIASQQNAMPVESTVLLDAVPWERTRKKIDTLKPARILSLRSEPSFCNEYARVLQFLQALQFPCLDLKVKGSGHCDAEGPSDFACYGLCGKKKVSYRHLFQQLMHGYLSQSLEDPTTPGQSVAFRQLLAQLASSGAITGSTVGSGATAHGAPLFPLSY